MRRVHFWVVAAMLAAGAARADQGVLGQGREAPSSLPAAFTPEARELRAVSPDGREFPAFGNFVAGGASQAFGMAFRTASHALERRRSAAHGEVRFFEGLLPSTCALGEVDGGCDDGNLDGGSGVDFTPLVKAAVVRDTANAQFRAAFYQDGDDMVSDMIRRIEARAEGGERHLIFALQSWNETRRRYVFVHSLREVAGAVEGTFYDPDMPQGQRQVGFRVQADEAGDQQMRIHRSWFAQAEAGGDTSFLGIELAAHLDDEFLPIHPRQLGFADFRADGDLAPWSRQRLQDDRFFAFGPFRHGHEHLRDRVLERSREIYQGEADQAPSDWIQ